jgi:hypothetical protein
MITDEQMSNDTKALDSIRQTLATLRAGKPNDRSEQARVYAVTITEIEKAMAYFIVFTTAAMSKPGGTP